MDGVRQLKLDIVEYLQKRGLDGAEVAGEYPAAARSFPLRRPLAVVGIAGAELKESGFGGYFGDDKTSAVYGRTAEVCVSFTLYCPTGGGGEGIHRLWEALCDILLDGVYGFYRMESGRISFDRDSGANVMEAKAWLRGGIVREDGAGVIGSFVVKAPGAGG